MGQKPEKDTFLSIYDYSQIMDDIFRYFREMGLAIVELWQQSAVLNDQRLEAIRKAFLEYFAMMEVNYGSRSIEMYAESKAMLNDIKPREVTDALYSLKSILVEEEIGIISGKIGRQPTNFEVPSPEAGLERLLPADGLRLCRVWGVQEVLLEERVEGARRPEEAAARPSADHDRLLRDR